MPTFVFVLLLAVGYAPILQMRLAPDAPNVYRSTVAWLWPTIERVLAHRLNELAGDCQIDRVTYGVRNATTGECQPQPAEYFRSSYEELIKGIPLIAWIMLVTVVNALLVMTFDAFASGPDKRASNTNDDIKRMLNQVNGYNGCYVARKMIHRTSDGQTVMIR